MTNNKPRAVAYLRISQDRRDLRLGVDRQLEDVHALAERLGLSLAPEDVFTDNDVTAAKVRKQDTAWARVLVVLKGTHPPAYLLGTTLDRLGRRLTDAEILDDLAKQTGLKVWTVQGGDVFSDPAWPIHVGIAKAESERTRQRVLRAKQQQRDRGIDSAGGNRPYGYGFDRRSVVPEEATIIREIVSRLVAGESAHSISRNLNDRGVKTSRESKHGWQPETIRAVAGSPRNVGKLVHRGEVVGEGAWQRILIDDEYRAVQVALVTTAKPIAGQQPKTLLGGLLYCGRCSTPMFSGTTKGKYPTYRCYARRQGSCGRTSRNRNVVDAYVEEKILERSDSEIVDRESKRLVSELMEVGRQDVALELEIIMLQEHWHAGDVGSGDFYPMLKSLRDRQARAQREEARVREELQGTAQAGVARRQWDDWDVSQKRALVQSLAGAIVFHPGGYLGKAARYIHDGELEIHWRS